MALIPRKPLFPLPSLEERRWAQDGGEFGKEVNEFLSKFTAQLFRVYDDIYRAFLRSWYPQYDTGNVSNPPTVAELNGLFGSPSVVGAGFTAIINDNGAGSNEYLIWSDGTDWWHVSGTKAL